MGEMPLNTVLLMGLSENKAHAVIAWALVDKED